MRSRALPTAASLILLICLICPVVEMFDQWDHTPQNGNDTEYTFVVLAVCAGAVLAIARVVLSAPVLASAKALICRLSLGNSLAPGRRGSFFVVPIPLSPPPLALRI